MKHLISGALIDNLEVSIYRVLCTKLIELDIILKTDYFQLWFFYTSDLPHVYCRKTYEYYHN